MLQLQYCTNDEALPAGYGSYHVTVGAISNAKIRCTMKEAAQANAKTRHPKTSIAKKESWANNQRPPSQTPNPTPTQPRVGRRRCPCSKAMQRRRSASSSRCRLACSARRRPRSLFYRPRRCPRALPHQKRGSPGGKHRQVPGALPLCTAPDAT